MLSPTTGTTFPNGDGRTNYKSFGLTEGLHPLKEGHRGPDPHNQGAVPLAPESLVS